MGRFSDRRDPSLAVRKIEHLRMMRGIPNWEFPAREIPLTSSAQIPMRKAYGVRQLYNNLSMLFLFPVKDGNLSTDVNANATFDASCYD